MKFENRRIYRKLKVKITDKLPTCEEEHRNDKEEEEGESVHVYRCCNAPNETYLYTTLKAAVSPFKIYFKINNAIKHAGSTHINNML